MNRQPMMWQRALQYIPATRLGAWFFAHTLHHIDPVVLRLSRGRLSLPGFFIGTPTMLVTTLGAKSNTPRTQPLIGIPDGVRVVLIASNWGRANNPAWYHNLRAHPHVSVSIDGRAQDFVAREVTGAEYDRYWGAAVELYRGYAAYQKRAGKRPIPIMALTPQR